MITIPLMAVFGLLLIVAVITLRGVGQAVEDLAGAPEDDYENNGFNIAGFVLAVVIMAILAGLSGLGPFAGVVAKGW